MSRSDPKWYLLGIIVLALFAILVPRHFDFSAYSDEGAYQVCQEIAMEYQTLSASQASDAEWQEFEAKALPRLEDVSNDIKAHWRSSETGATQVLYQASQYELPKLIMQRGKAVDARAEATVDTVLVQARKVIDAPRPLILPETSQKDKNDNPSQWDPLIVMILIGDTALTIAGVGYWSYFRQ